MMIDGDEIFVAGCVLLSTRIDGWKMNEDGTGIAGCVSLSKSVSCRNGLMDTTKIYGRDP